MSRRPLVLGTWGRIKRVQRGNTWVAYARFYDYDGVTRPVERSGATARKAEDALVQHLRDRTRLHRGDLTPESHVRVLADRWYDMPLEQGKATGTLEQYRRILRLHVEPALGALRIREVTVPIIDRFIGATDKKSASTGHLARVVLNGMFSLAVRHGAAATNPVRDAQTITVERPDVRVIDLADVVLVRRQLREWDSSHAKAGRTRVGELGDLVDMLFATGLRTGELMSLRWDDIDLAADVATVLVQSTAVQVRGEGLVRQNRPKTDSSFRGLKLPAFAVAMLLRPGADAYTEWVFPSSTGTLRSPSNMRRQWRDFRKHFGYGDWLTPKSFRKTVATLIRDGVDLDAAGAQLGHSNTRVPEAHYTGRVHDGPDVREVLERFGI